MRCPSCQRPIDHEAVSCYSCNYSAIHAVRRFGSNKVLLRRIHDAADCLRVDDMRQINEQFDQLEHRFPQLNFAIFLGELNTTIPLSELSFWLLNQSRIEASERETDNASTILLMVDLSTKQSGIALGYQAELLLTEEDCSHALKPARKALQDERFAKGIHLVFKNIEKSLVKKSRQLQRMTREETQAWMSVDQQDNSLSIPNHPNPQPMPLRNALPEQRAAKPSVDPVLVEN